MEKSMMDEAGSESWKRRRRLHRKIPMTQCLEQVVWALALTANVGVGVVVDAADNSVHDPTTSHCAVPSRRR